MQTAAIVVSVAVTLIAVALAGRAVGQIVGVIRLGQPIAGRTDQPGRRTSTMLRETLGHTRMLKWSLVGASHWFVFIGFGLLFFTLVTAYGQLFDAEFVLPAIGGAHPFEWAAEFITWAMLIGITVLVAIRLRAHPARTGRTSRFTGSRMWQGYYVEATVIGVGVCILVLRGLEYALGAGDVSHFPLTFFIGDALAGLPNSSLENLVYLVAAVKILISMAWLIVIALNTTMGVAWHRFTAFPNVFFKREADGSNALGAAKPLTVNGQPVDFEKLDDLDEDAVLGAGKVEDFSWKGLLDFTTCTECGRCQSQCPAWNTGKPLSPKLLVMGLREHAYAKAPYLLAGRGTNPAGDEQATSQQLAEVPATAIAEAERPLVGTAEQNGVVDPEVLWSCTTCGACVEQCPVDIEHVDHILDLRRYQTMIEAEFPSELNGLFRNLEKSGNPWGMNVSKRMEWAAGLPFEVRQVGVDVETLDDVDWLLWVGCAGAFEDRAKKTTQALAELLHTAGVSFAVLGDGETCTGDPARRSGNEFLYQQLAMQNVEVLRESQATKVVVTCAHCFNTLKNEYPQLGLNLEVVHHTQLLNRLVRDGRLTPVAANGSVAGRPVTYHDPCYLGRHNQVYEPPRELVGALPGVELREMTRSGSRSFCCGAGGARMWMEERIGKRINTDRTEEALATGASAIAVGCPFCRIMLSDGVTAAQAAGQGDGVEVLDVAQLLLESVKRRPLYVAAEQHVEIRPFRPDDAVAAGRLLADRQRRARSPAATLRTQRFEQPDVCEQFLRLALDRGAAGAIAEKGRRVLGFLLATPGDDLRGRHVWSGLEQHALAADVDRDIVRQLYADLAKGWVDDGRLHHYAVVPVTDVEPWLALGFSREQVHAVCSTSVSEAKSPVPIRRAGPADVDAVQSVARLVADANVATPVFAYVGEDFYSELAPSTSELIEDETVDYWIAEHDGEVVGFIALRPVPSDEDSLLKPAGLVELIVAATLPRVRGMGVGVALFEHGARAAASRGRSVFVADWRAANPTASAFWPRRGFRPFAYRMHRVIDPRFGPGQSDRLATGGASAKRQRRSRNEQR
jgi:Fe-S oxidoreductase/ribosomal protein S18 acetylase RimI-like enzyme